MTEQKNKVYISGPMRGYPDHNFPAFNEVTVKWRAASFNVLNPAENFNGSQDVDIVTCLKVDYNQLINECNALALLPGWDKSVGATTELAIAKSLGYTIYDALNPGKLYDFDKKPSVCELADKLVTVDRQKAYGSPNDDFTRSTDLLNAIGFRFKDALTGEMLNLNATHIPIVMTLVKLSRMMNNKDFYHHDSLTDICGYMKCLQMVAEERGKV